MTNNEAYTGDTSAYDLPRAQIAGCALVQDLLPLYIDGEVSPASHALIADHLAQCERCSGFLAGARSVRSQILDEESKLRAAFAKAPAVAAVQAPVWSSPLATLWRFMMLLLWLAALAITALGVLEPAPPAIVLGAFGTLAAIGGLLIAGGEQRLEWRIGMLLTGLLGIGCVTLGMLSFGYGLSGPIVLGGLMQLVIATWGLWPRPPRALVQATAQAPNSRQPMLSALLSLAGIALSAGLILGGVGTLSRSQSVPVDPLNAGVAAVATVEDMAAADKLKAQGAFEALPAVPVEPIAPMMVKPVEVVYGGPSWPSILVGTALTAAGIAGVLIIARRRGWLPHELRGLSPRRWLGYGLVTVGLLWLSVALRALLAGVLPSLPAIGISTALLLLGWALARCAPPEEPRVV